MITDCHTHRTDARDAIINVSPDYTEFLPGRFYSVGIHPWLTAEMPAEGIGRLMELLPVAARRSDVVAIGESGFDRLRGGDMGLQRELFNLHARLADDLGKPLIIHCVRAWNDLLQARRDMDPHAPWIVHGFRGKPELARQLTDAGMYISLGERFNPATAPVIPPERLLVETDESDQPIDAIAAAVSPTALGDAARNLQKILTL